MLEKSLLNPHKHPTVAAQFSIDSSLSAFLILPSCWFNKSQLQQSIQPVVFNYRVKPISPIRLNVSKYMQ